MAVDKGFSVPWAEINYCLGLRAQVLQGEDRQTWGWLSRWGCVSADRRFLPIPGSLLWPDHTLATEEVD